MSDVKIKSVSIEKKWYKEGDGFKVDVRVQAGNHIIDLVIGDDEIVNAFVSAIINVMSENSNAIVKEIKESFGVNDDTGN